MRTRTIYDACDEAERIWNPYSNDRLDTYPQERVDRAERQCRKFYAELLRRMDERDSMAAKAKAWDALQKWKALDEAGFCSYYDLNKAKDAADAAASEVA